jgi:D-glycero-beta-D-manno-heptose-7-phosphate kinase
MKAMTSPLSDRTALLALVERFPRQHVIMLGDLVADESVYGEIMRVSREAPVLILKEREASGAWRRGQRRE